MSEPKIQSTYNPITEEDITGVMRMLDDIEVIPDVPQVLKVNNYWFDSMSDETFEIIYGRMMKGEIIVEVSRSGYVKWLTRCIQLGLRKELIT